MAFKHQTLLKNLIPSGKRFVMIDYRGVSYEGFESYSVSKNAGMETTSGS